MWGQTKRIGEEVEYNKEMSLYDWVSGSGFGLSGISRPQELPKEMYQFMVDQYARFNVPVPTKNILLEAAWSTFFTVDYCDPYALLMGLSDVEVTEEWAHHTYDIVMGDGQIQEADPELLETYRLVPGQDRVMFEKIMSNPGLQYIELGTVGDLIEESLSGAMYSDDDAYMRVDDADRKWLDIHCPPFTDPILKPQMNVEIEIPMESEKYHVEIETCKPNLHLYKKYLEGTRYKGMEIFDRPDVQNYFNLEIQNEQAHQTRMNYFRLGAWAALAWLVSPYPKAKEFRELCWDMFYSCYRTGECVLYAGTFLKKDSYRKLSRPVKSCYACGVASWCVELTTLHGVNRPICEHHLNGELPKIAPVTCGTKVCRFAECPHHPYHGMKDARGLAYRNTGALGGVVARNAPHLVYNNDKQKLLC